MLFSFTIIFVSFLTLIIQTTILPYLQIAMVKPDLPLIVVIYVALYFEDSDSMPIAFTFGIVQDSLSHGLFGLQAMTNCIAVVMVILLKNIFYSEDFVGGYVIAFIIIVMNAFASAYLTNYLWLVKGNLLWGKLALVVVYNSLFVPPLFFLIGFVHSKYTLFTGRFSKI